MLFFVYSTYVVNYPNYRGLNVPYIHTFTFVLLFVMYVYLVHMDYLYVEILSSFYLVSLDNVSVC